MEQPLEKILERLTELSESFSTSFGRMEREVQEIKDARYRPYFASMGGFLVITLGVMGYVYGLELRTRTGMIELMDRINTVNQRVEVNAERMNINQERLEQRSQNQAQTWAVHSKQHDALSEGMRILVEKLIDKPGRAGS